ncbi:putative RNA-binding protein [Ruminiclostridium sufflavum DSM 19573]|uniref:Putative RNA-binding protein n=1 Tax=Ruminiclostridium sufflavum DSM 19573 TaxID=1121337 RepID=A0A318XFL4_9FIRM|nr:CooT family nickel-binding protein [Ruminiclostridium sufflavum]PYG84303.1 putative RNA-binding protein [Ruminiclostridium sufflavum DSM 19573]
MCEANVYLLNEKGEERLFLESVDKIIPNGDELCLEDIFNRKKYIKAKIKEMELVEHRIILEKID